jgi:hypothetical protein
MAWIFVAVFALVLIGVFLVRPRVSKHYSGDFQGIKVEAILGPIITLTVFLGAIVIAQSTQTFQRANQQSNAEAGAVEQLFKNAALLPENSGEAIQATSVCYARAVVAFDWPAMQELTPSPQVDTWERAFDTEIPKVFAGPSPVVGQLVGLNRLQTEARNAREYDAAPHLPLLTLILMVGAVLCVVLAVSSFAVVDMSRRILTPLAMIFALLLGSTVFLVEQLEEPFTGLVRVSSESMQKVATEIGADYESAYPNSPLPCDSRGAERT